MAETALQKSTVRPQETRDLSQQMLGAAKYATVIHKQTASDMIRFLIMVRDDKRFLDYDCLTFEEFLDSGHSPISKTTFYRHLELFKKEGDNYDLLEDWHIPARWRRQLTDGEFSVDGDSVVIGEHRVAMGDETVIRRAFESLVKDRIATKKKIEQLEGYRAKYDVLKAAVDAAADEPEYVTAIGQALKALNVLIAEAKDLPGDMKGERGSADLPQIYLLTEQLCDAFGEMLPWNRGSWIREMPDRTQPYLKSDAIDGDNF